MPTIRQYIGARYTPKFMGTYDATQSYEALSVVDNGMGTTYINEKPTPAGTPLTNTDYWHVYGASSGAIIDLQNRLDSIEKGRDIIIIGASMMTTPSVADNMMVYLEPLLSNYFDNIFSAAYGGYGFVNGGYLTLLQSISTSHPERVVKIVVVGTTNDATEAEADVLAAMATFKTWANTHYPNASIELAPVAACARRDFATTIFEQYNWLNEHVTDFEMAILNDTYHILALGYDVYISSDGTHPTSAGAKLLANSVFNAIIGNSFDLSRKVYQSTVDSKQYTAEIGTPTFTSDTLWLDTDSVYGLVSLNFTQVSNMTIYSYWDSNYFMTANPALKGINLDNLKEFQGYLTDKTDDVTFPIGATLREDVNHDYWYGINTKVGEARTLTAGHEYALRFVINFPFKYN